MLIVFIVSPDGPEWAAHQARAAHAVLDSGNCPVAPLTLRRALQDIQDRPAEEYDEADMSLMTAASVLLRLPGESKQADAAEDLFRLLGRQVCVGLDGLQDYLDKNS